MNDQQKQFSELISEYKQFISEVRGKLKSKSLVLFIEYWRDYERCAYQGNYAKEIDEIFKNNIIPKTLADGKAFTVGGLRHINHKAVINYIKKRDDWSATKRENITNCYMDLIKWLDKVSFGWFKEDLPFYQMSPCAIEQALTFSEWCTFIKTFSKKNKRDELIARALYLGQKRVSNVIKLTVSQIDFENNIIHYESRRGESAVHHEASYMKELQEYIKSTANLRRKDSPFVFITRKGKPVTRLRLNYSFAQASKLAFGNIKRVTPDSLRNIICKLHLIP